jgi:hypothetical protein
MICLTATSISSLLLFFYFKNKLSGVEEKLDSMFQLIQNYALQSEKRSSQEPEWTINENNNYPSSGGGDQLSESSEQLQHSNVNLIKVSDGEHTESESDSDSEEDSEDESDRESNTDDGKDELNQHLPHEQESSVHDNEHIENKESKSDDSLDEVDDEDDEDDENEQEDDENGEEDEEFPHQIELETPEKSVKKINVKEEADYERMRVSDLKNLAKDRGLSGYRNLRKSDLIELLSQ